MHAIKVGQIFILSSLSPSRYYKDAELEKKKKKPSNKEKEKVPT